MWQKKWTGATWLFMVNRYGTLAYGIISALQPSNPTVRNPNSALFVADIVHTEVRCVFTRSRGVLTRFRKLSHNLEGTGSSCGALVYNLLRYVRKELPPVWLVLTCYEVFSTLRVYAIAGTGRLFWAVPVFILTLTPIPVYIVR